jgi:hypothetical membrane protein
MKATRLGPLLWLCCLQFFVAERIVALNWPGTYSFARNFISDLGAAHCEAGAVCSPWHGLMNASFSVQGVLILFGTAGVWPRLARGWLSKSALTLIGASGFGVFLVGLAPEDVAPDWHYFGAAENFLFCNAGAALLGLAMWPRTRVIAVFSLIAGLLGLAGLACIPIPRHLGFGVGVVERVAAYPFPLWVAMMGAWMLSRAPAAPPP